MGFVLREADPFSKELTENGKSNCSLTLKEWQGNHPHMRPTY